jgi:hypothetical protein
MSPVPLSETADAAAGEVGELGDLGPSAERWGRQWVLQGSGGPGGRRSPGEGGCRCARARVAPIVAWAAVVAGQAGCFGGPLGSITCDNHASIAFTGPVLTEAAAGFVYSQGLEASSPGIIGTMHGIEPVSVPPGALVYAGGVSWTPGPGDANTTVGFTVRSEEPDLCGDAATLSWSIHVSPAIEITRFEAIPARVSTRGAPVQLVAEFSGGTGVLTSPFSAPLTSGAPLDVGVVSAPTTFTVTVANASGYLREQSVTVQVEYPPIITEFRAVPSILTVGDPVDLSWSLAGNATGLTLDPGGLVLQPWSGWMEIHPSGQTTYTLTARNDVGDVATAVVTPAILPPPAIESFTASPASPPFLGSTEVLAVFGGGTGHVVPQRSGLTTQAVTSGVPLPLGPLHGNLAYTLTVTNDAGRSLSRDLVLGLSGPGTWELQDGAVAGYARYGYTATPLADGRLLVAGGSSGCCDYQYPGATEIFDPTTGTTRPGPSLLHPRQGHAAVRLADGRVLLAGGTQDMGRPVDEAEILDLPAGTSVAAGSVGDAWYRPQLVALPDGSAILHDASIYSSRGAQVLRLDPGTSLLSTLTTVFDLGWTRSFPMPDGRVLLLGGGLYGLTPSQLLDPQTGQVTSTGTTLREMVSFMAIQLVDGRVLAFDGSPAEIYDPATGLFVAVGDPLAPPHGWGGQPALLPDGRVLLVGFPDCGILDPETGASEETGCPLAGDQLALLPDGTVLGTGGWVVERYRPP